jgi:chromate transporter
MLPGAGIGKAGRPHGHWPLRQRVSTSATLLQDDQQPPADDLQAAPGAAWREVFAVFLRLGLTSFGGPIAHVAWFHREFVVRRRWLGEEAFAELVSLCQFLPGPASSQIGIALGFRRAGLVGSVLAWAGFTLPSAVLMTAFALGLPQLGMKTESGWLSGLKVFAVAVVAQAVWSMGRSLCPDITRRAIAVAVTGVLLLAPLPGVQVVAMALAGLAGKALLGAGSAHRPAALRIQVPPRAAVAALLAGALLLVGLPVLAAWTQADLIELAAVFYRAGALVFGGGHVVLPLLQAQVVPSGWIGNDAFLAGYAAAQVMPGPLFSFAAYLGAAIPLPGGVTGASVALLAIFVPAFLLVLGALPFWQGALQRPGLRAAVSGVNAGVVGVLLATLVTPLAGSALASVPDAALALAALTALHYVRAPVWIVAAACAICGALLH